MNKSVLLQGAISCVRQWTVDGEVLKIKAALAAAEAAIQECKSRKPEVAADRFKVEYRDGGECGDHYCSGHRAQFLVDTVSGHEEPFHPPLDRQTVQLLNFMARVNDWNLKTHRDA